VWGGRFDSSVPWDQLDETRFAPCDHAFKNVHGFTPDGRALLYSRLDAATKWDLWLLPPDGGPPKVLLNTPAHETSGDISSDGRWLCYRSDESGPTEQYIAPFATPGLKYQVTIGGGFGGFSFDGKRFYFGLVR
jgi:Tol biopolymer transport system component